MSASHQNSPQELLGNAFDPAAIEPKWLKIWQNLPQKANRPYHVMQLPPPNVTGILHMGHAFNQTILDALARHARMTGFFTLWIPGTDHAGIATQIIVEKQLEAENISRHDLNKEAFLERVWQWKAQSGHAITEQMRRMGSLLNWSYEYFTMDTVRQRAVQEAFVRLHRQGLIYRGKRLVNWDSKLRTAISDLEVVHKEEQTKLWHILYPFADGPYETEDAEGHSTQILGVTVATTRPETLFGDVAVCVHPEDPRYARLIGKQLLLPLTQRKIPIIGDEFVSPEFGSGCVKITPAHDFNDYACALRHGLESIDILTDDACLNEHVPTKFRGLSVMNARQQVSDSLNQQGLLIKTKAYTAQQAYSDRSDTVVEPRLTDQWFLAVKKKIPLAGTTQTASLAELAIAAVKTGNIEFLPENWQNHFLAWLENIEDWCISRQLWWGHAIPAWHGNHGEVFVATSQEEAHALAQEQGYFGLLQAESDVLDTWFSSALIPFSSLGWPDGDEQIFKACLPSTILVTGFDILFFWVARMVMLSLNLLGKIPFEKVYIHGLIRDSSGQKMSKSKGNTLDPLDLILGITQEDLVKKRVQHLMQPKEAENIAQKTKKEFPAGIPALGCDALRFTFAAQASLGRYINFDLTQCQGYRNFCNKLWQASRFVLAHCAALKQKIGDIPELQKVTQTPADRWICSRLQQTIAEINKSWKNYRFDYIAAEIFHFTWEIYCDWYLECAKLQLLQEGAVAESSCATLLYVLNQILHLAHPLLPFTTEELAQALRNFSPQQQGKLSILENDYPVVVNDQISPEDEAWGQELQTWVDAIRALRSELKLAPKRQIPLLVWIEKEKSTNLCAKQMYIEGLTKTKIQYFEQKNAFEQASEQAVTIHVNSLSMALIVDVNPAEKQAKLAKDIAALQKELTFSAKKLDDPRFIERAPHTLVTKERERYARLQNQLQHFQQEYAKTTQI